jgi:hypothetical protein
MWTFIEPPPIIGVIAMRRYANYYNDTTAQKKTKILSLLNIYITSGKISTSAADFLQKMGDIIYRKNAIPGDALSEKQARATRKILFQNHSKVKSMIPALPGGVKFEDEVRRLLKTKANPNEGLNQQIKKGEVILESEFVPTLTDEVTNFTIEYAGRATTANSTVALIYKVTFEGYSVDVDGVDYELNRPTYSGIEDEGEVFVGVIFFGAGHVVTEEGFSVDDVVSENNLTLQTRKRLARQNRYPF